MQRSFGSQGNSKVGVMNTTSQLQRSYAQKHGSLENNVTKSQIMDEDYENNMNNKLIDDNLYISGMRMDTSQSGLQQNYAANNTQYTQQGSSKGNIHSSSYIHYDNQQMEQIKKTDYQRGASNTNRNKVASNRNMSQGNQTNTDKEEKFGFVKYETIYGNEKGEGLLNSGVYVTSLQNYVKERADNKRGGNTMNTSVMSRMQEHIQYTNELQKRFIEQNMNLVDAAAHERFLKYENNEQSILNKLNSHILYVKERDHINQLTKAEMMKNSFIPNKDEDEAEVATRPKAKNANNSPVKPKPEAKSPRVDLDQKPDSPKLIQVHKDSNNNIINKIIEKPLLKLQSSNPSSQKNSLQTSPRQPQSKFTYPAKASVYKESSSPTRRPIIKPESTEEPEILLDNIARFQSAYNEKVEEQKNVPFLKQPTLKNTQQQEQIDEKQMLQKNRKALKNKIDKIITHHQKVIKDIDYAYQEVTEQIKRKELDQRQRSMTDVNSPFNQPQHIKELGGGPALIKNNFQRLGKQIIQQNKTGFAQVLNHSYNNPTSSNAPKRNSIMINNQALQNQIATPQSQGAKMSAIQSLEFQRKQLLENIQNTQNENKIYFQAKFKIREKGLNFDLSNSNNKEQVLDRVLMNYFHQQDLLNEQENLLKKAQREKKSGRSTGRGKSYKTKELGSLLSKFQPKHMRLHLKDITKGVSGGLSSTMQQTQQTRQRSMTAGGGSRKQSYVDKTLNQSEQNYKDFQDEENVDFDVFREKYDWKKQQNKIINFSKVCSPAEMVLQFMKQDPRYKKQQNIEAIDYLVQFDPKKAKEEEDMEGKEADVSENQEKFKKRFDDSILRRCFFFYSNKNDSNTSDRFQEITLQKFLTIFYNISGKEYDESIDQEISQPNNSEYQQEPQKNEISFFGHILKHKLHINVKGENTTTNRQTNKYIILGDNTIEIHTLKTIFEKITSKKEKPVLNYYEFLEAIRKTSVQYYLKKISQDQIPQPQELFERFFTEYIKPQHMSFRDPEEQELLKMREFKQIDSLLKLYEDNLKDLFVFAGSMRSQTTYDFSQIYLGFQEMYEILQKLDFFPNKISKTTIRYIYYYTLSLDQGLDFHDFCQCLHLIGLRIIRYPLKNVPKTQTPQDVYLLQRKCREIQYTIFKLKQENNLNPSIQKFIQDISLFYVHSDYIDYQKIQQKIISIKESNQKQLQMM